MISVISHIDNMYSNDEAERIRAWKKMATELRIEIVENPIAVEARKKAALAAVAAEYGMDL